MAILRERWNDAQKKTGEFVGTAAIVGALGGFCDTRTIERISACVTRSEGQSAKLAAWLNR